MLDYFYLMIAMWETLITAASGMGPLSWILYVLFTIVMIIVSVFVPIIVVFALIYTALVIGFRVGIAVCLIMIVVAANTSLKSMEEHRALSAIQNELGLNSREAQTLRVAQKEFDSLMPAHVALWREEMNDRSKVEKSFKEAKSFDYGRQLHTVRMETQRSSLRVNQDGSFVWSWKQPELELKNPASLYRPGGQVALNSK